MITLKQEPIKKKRFKIWIYPNFKNEQLTQEKKLTNDL